MSEGAVFTVASCKGGCCKSTTCLILAGEYAAQGHQVHIIDSDPRKRLFKWAEAGVKPKSITASTANSTTLRDEIEKARAAADVVLIDVEGSANAEVAIAISFSNIVIVPATISPPDVEDALTTVKLIQTMAAASRRQIPYGLLWSAVPPAIRSREMINLEAQVAESGIPVIGRVFHRSAFASLYSFQTTLDELPSSEVSGIEKAKADAIKLTEALGAMMESPAAVEGVAA